MRIHVENTKCVGHALCHAMNPELFPIDDSGYSALTSPTVDTENEPEARQGIDACPEGALRLEYN